MYFVCFVGKIKACCCCNIFDIYEGQFALLLLRGGRPSQNNLYRIGSRNEKCICFWHSNAIIQKPDSVIADRKEILPYSINGLAASRPRKGS